MRAYFTPSAVARSRSLPPGQLGLEDKASGAPRRLAAVCGSKAASGEVAGEVGRIVHARAPRRWSEDGGLSRSAEASRGRERREERMTQT